MAAAANPIVLIPARMQSSRLPGKPLAEIGGEAMIVHVWRRAMEADIGPVVVAAAEDAIVEAVRAAGGDAVLTRADHPSGSDRIFEAVGRIDPDGRFDAVVNLQGDLPTLDPALPRAALAALAASPEVDIATLVCATDDVAERDNPNVVKAVVSFAEDGKRGPRAVFHPRGGPVGRGAGVSPYRPVCLSPGGAGAVRRPAAKSAGEAGAAGAVAGAGSRHAH